MKKQEQSLWRQAIKTEERPLPMLPVGDSTVIRRIIITMRRVGIDPIVVVTGKQGDELEKHISDLEVISCAIPITKRNRCLTAFPWVFATSEDCVHRH